MKLVIVESPSKTQKINGILAQLYGQGNFRVVASMGHIRDLPRKDMGVDIEHGFRPTYVVHTAKKRAVARLKKAVGEVDELYLAADPDREGEAIAWHILQVTKPRCPVYRVMFNAITKEAIREAFAAPRQIDMELVHAQETRRIMDRLVGYRVSAALWSGLDNHKLSAGRVQSMALRLVVERQREIEAFVPREYWSIEARFKVQMGEFVAKLIGWQNKQWTDTVFKSREEAESVVQQLASAQFVVQKMEQKTVQRQPPAPFITSTLQQAASTHLKLSPDKVMSIAQSLYESGHITYMRTDAPAVSAEAAESAGQYIVDSFGDEYLPDKRRQFKAKSGSQEAHECIRPTHIELADISTEVEDGDVYSARLYDLIWKRFMASQMASARYQQTSIYVTGGGALFLSRGKILEFDGWTRVYAYGEDVEKDGADSDDEGTGELPMVVQGERCACNKCLKVNDHWTRPPAMYTEASLVRALEQRGIGRPSTFAGMVSTIKQRKYVSVKSRKMQATALGCEVTDFLLNEFNLIFDYDFTKTMEDSLDRISLGDLDATAFLSVFWKQFEPMLAKWPYLTQCTQTDASASRKNGTDSPSESTSTNEVCPLCGKGEMLIRTSRQGKRFLSCSAYPKCKYSRNINVPSPVLANKTCPDCGAPLVVKSSKTGNLFLGCLRYPACKHTENHHG